MADHRPACFLLSLMFAMAAAAQDSRPPSLPSSLQDQITQHEQKLSQSRAARNLKEETSELVSLLVKTGVVELP